MRSAALGPALTAHISVFSNAMSWWRRFLSCVTNPARSAASVVTASMSPLRRRSTHLLIRPSAMGLPLIALLSSVREVEVPSEQTFLPSSCPREATCSSW